MRRRGTSQPREGAATAQRKSTKERGVLGEVSSLRRSFANDEHGDDVRDAPAEISCDAGRKPRLDVDPTERLLGIVHARLDFDHGDGSSRGVPCEDVDPAALTKVVEAHLDARVPPVLRK
jgi:hypothetical protein